MSTSNETIVPVAVKTRPRRPDPQIASKFASVLASLDLELIAGGDRGHQDRLRRLRRAGRVADETYFEAIDLERRGLP